MSRIILPGPMELAYPVHNRFDLPLEFTDRRLNVVSVTDYATSGFPAKRLIKFPLVRRGRNLVEAIDLDTLAKRHFWVEAQTRRNSDLPEYRLGLYDPAFPGELVDWVGRIFGPTEHEQLRMRKVVMRWYAAIRRYNADVPLKLAAFPVEYKR